MKGVQWNDDYWLLLMQVYLQKPVGVKPVYSKAMVTLALELHIHPQTLFNKMCSLANLQTPRLERIWQQYVGSPSRLARAVRLLREMRGFSHADAFYEGVELNETFERDFRPIEGSEPLTPVMLILILDVYFRLTPNTMVAKTPEVIQLARLLGIHPETVVDVMESYQYCDPYLNRPFPTPTPLLAAAQRIWLRFGNSNPVQLASYASQLSEYFH